MRKVLNMDVVEDGFSLEAEGYNIRQYKDYFKGLPKLVLQRLLRHFKARKEGEVCRLIMSMLHQKDRRLGTA